MNERQGNLLVFFLLLAFLLAFLFLARDARQLEPDFGISHKDAAATELADSYQVWTQTADHAAATQRFARTLHYSTPPTPTQEFVQYIMLMRMTNSNTFPIRFRICPGTSCAVLGAVQRNGVITICSNDIVEANGLNWKKVLYQGFPAGWTAIDLFTEYDSIVKFQSEEFEPEGCQ